VYLITALLFVGVRESPWNMWGDASILLRCCFTNVRVFRKPVIVILVSPRQYALELQRAVPIGISGMTGATGDMGDIGASGEGGGLNCELVEPNVGDGDGMMGVRASTGAMSFAAGLGLCRSLRVAKNLRNSGRKNGIDAEMIPACCSTWLQIIKFAVFSPCFLISVSQRTTTLSRIEEATTAMIPTEKMPTSPSLRLTGMLCKLSRKGIGMIQIQASVNKLKPALNSQSVVGL